MIIFRQIGEELDIIDPNKIKCFLSGHSSECFKVIQIVFAQNSFSIYSFFVVVIL